MKRILFVMTLPPPVHGSAVISQYIRNSKVINESFDCDYINLATSRSMEEIGMRNLKKLWRLAVALMTELWLLLTRRYDLCYLAITCHGIGFLKDAPFVLMCKLFQKKIIIHQHNKGLSLDVNRWPYKWLLPFVYRNTKVILLSWRLYPDIEKVAKKEDVYICPNGINVQFKCPYKTWNVESEASSVPRLLFLSNLIESKGVFVLLYALKMLKDKGYSFICEFVGGETKEINAKRFAEEVERLGLNELAVYQGRKYGEDKEQVLEKTDIFVFPTYYPNETFGLVNLEAMAHHKPVVTTNEGGIPDIIEDGVNGLICEKRNAESLAMCLEKLITDKNLRQEMGKEGFRRYKSKYTLEIFENRFKDVLKDTLRADES